MYLRVQWVARVVRGVVTRVEAALAGLSLSVSGALQDELLNLTAYRLALTNVLTTSEFKAPPPPLSAVRCFCTSEYPVLNKGPISPIKGPQAHHMIQA